MYGCVVVQLYSLPFSLWTAQKEASLAPSRPNVRAVLQPGYLQWSFTLCRFFELVAGSWGTRRHGHIRAESRHSQATRSKPRINQSVDAFKGHDVIHPLWRRCQRRSTSSSVFAKCYKARMHQPSGDRTPPLPHRISCFGVFSEK